MRDKIYSTDLTKNTIAGYIRDNANFGIIDGFGVQQIYKALELDEFKDLNSALLADSRTTDIGEIGINAKFLPADGIVFAQHIEGAQYLVADLRAHNVGSIYKFDPEFGAARISKSLDLFFSEYIGISKYIFMFPEDCKPNDNIREIYKGHVRKVSQWRNLITSYENSFIYRTRCLPHAIETIEILDCSERDPKLDDFLKKIRSLSLPSVEFDYSKENAEVKGKYWVVFLTQILQKGCDENVLRLGEVRNRLKAFIALDEVVNIPESELETWLAQQKQHIAKLIGRRAWEQVFEGNLKWPMGKVATFLSLFGKE